MLFRCKIGIFILLLFYICSCSILKTARIPVDGLVAYFPFNGNADDESGNNNNGIVNGATLTADRHNKSNSAYFFEGRNDIEIPNSSFFNNMNSFSVSVWVYPTEIKHMYNAIISKVNPNRDIDLKISKGNMKYAADFAYNSAYFSCTSKSSAEFHKWTHIVYQWTGEKIQLYINGTFDSSNDQSGNTPPWTGKIMAIGSMNGTEFFTGKIDDVRIYNRVLSKQEIKSLFNEKE